MAVLIAIALKSLLVAGLTLGLLTLMRRRCAAERSWVAHVGLFALVIMAFAPLVLPRWHVQAPVLFASAPATSSAIEPEATLAKPSTIRFAAPAARAAPAPSSVLPKISAASAASAIYALPAAILLLITLFALGRLIALRARAEVLVDGHWLSALARAQRRMGFKHGTALLTSDELSSPISWGLVRPVILLNRRAVEASSEAEAIIAHELAHVARMDWAKLLLARVAAALFWFNPLVWILAREAHQLREETADDAVLAADIADTDYAQLLVGVARHECPGLLLTAHGVAPSRSSLARRVARVLDGKSIRGPGRWSFASGVFVGAMVVAAPLAALTLTPGGPRLAASSAGTDKGHFGRAYAAAADVPADLPHILARGVSTSVATAAAAIAPVGRQSASTDEATAADGAKVVSRDGLTVAKGADGATVTVYPPNARGLSRVVATSATGATAVAYVNPNEYGLGAGVPTPPLPPAPPTPPWTRRNAVDGALELRAVGVTPQYVAAMKSLLPQLDLSADDLASLKAVGVTPDFLQELVREGYRNPNVGDITGAYAVGVRSDYIRGMAAAGYGRIPLAQLTELRAVGVTPGELARFRRAGFKQLDTDELVQDKALGVLPKEIPAGRDDP